MSASEKHPLLASQQHHGHVSYADVYLSSSSPSSSASSAEYVSLPVGYPHGAHDITVSSSRVGRVKPGFSWAGLLWGLVSWALYLTFIATFLSCLYLTARFLHADCEKPLQLLTAVVGSCGLVWILVIPYQVHLEEHAAPTWEPCCFRLTWLLRLSCLLPVLAVTIAGSVWVFGDMRGKGAELQCPAALYDFCWWLLIGWWSVAGLVLAIATTIVCVMCSAFMG